MLILGQAPSIDDIYRISKIKNAILTFYLFLRPKGVLKESTLSKRRINA